MKPTMYGRLPEAASHLSGGRGVAALAVLSLVTITAVGDVVAQGYTLRIDSRFQSVAYRGVQRDSILATDVVTGPTGGYRTPDGFAVRCPAGNSFCYYFKPGPVQQGSPWVTTADASLWGFGVRGLRAHVIARLGIDIDKPDVWPGTNPPVQLLEGYLEYAIPLLTAIAGRTHVTTRFGYTGFDGAKITFRLLDRRLSAEAYGGWGLARGIDLPVTSPALNPINDFQPGARQILAGATLGWNTSIITARAFYQREVDTRTNKFVSERAGLDAALRPHRMLALSGGADYDMAFGWLGSAEAMATFIAPRQFGSITAGVRRYRPHFDLWTIWGAFSPVPYRAAFGDLRAVPLRGLELRGRVEAYQFDDTETSTPLVQVEDSGWRWTTGFSLTRWSRWSVAYDFHREFGSGGSSNGFDLRGSVQPLRRLTATAELGRVHRPLEFRFNDATLWVYGLRADYFLQTRLRVNLAVRHYDETRDRADAAAFSWSQLRVDVGLMWYMGSGISTSRIHPAVLRIPNRGGAP